jgi:hypothetical protein
MKRRVVPEEKHVLKQRKMVLIHILSHALAPNYQVIQPVTRL